MKRHAPATSRNSEPLAAVLAAELPKTGTVLEIASGTGEHAVFLAQRFPELVFQPTDLDPDALASIAGWIGETTPDNILPPKLLDASRDWPDDISADAVLCVNMVHISPWDATLGLFAGATTLLSSGQPLILYGPYLEDDLETAQSNIAFDKSLRMRNPQWGIRRIETMDEAASSSGFVRTARHAMPANNLTLVYRKS